MRRAIPAASSIKSRSRRWRFSISASRPDSSSSTDSRMHGTSLSPASRAARRRRSPATSSIPSGVRRTVSGWRMPNCAMLAASSWSAAESKTRRGCDGFGWIAPSGRNTILPESIRVLFLVFGMAAAPPRLVCFIVNLLCRGKRAKSAQRKVYSRIAAHRAKCRRARLCASRSSPLRHSRCGRRRKDVTGVFLTLRHRANTLRPASAEFMCSGMHAFSKPN